MRKGILLAAIAAVTLLAVSSAWGAGKPLATRMTGAAEVPGPGDADGTGEAVITLNHGRQEVCFQLNVRDITLPATGAHIHVGSETVAGPVVVGLTPPDESGTSSGCVTADQDLIKEIMQNPASYYVNVHNTDFPGGAIRGQL
jgi:hypothetical protein